jgi:peptidoglycan/LPS O-acetylase OafA/YrhL
VAVISSIYFWRRSAGPLAALLDVTLIGQDIAGGLQWVNRTAFAIPQAWSLSIEITYYVAAALLFTLPYGIPIAFVGDLALYLLLWWLDAVSVMSSPSMFVFFAAGGVAYLVYVKIKLWPQTVKVCLALTGVWPSANTCA